MVEFLNVFDRKLSYEEMTKLETYLEKLKEEQQLLGLKIGLELAKKCLKKKGYEFVFPNPEKIKIEQQSSGEYEE